MSSSPAPSREPRLGGAPGRVGDDAPAVRRRRLGAADEPARRLGVRPAGRHDPPADRLDAVADGENCLLVREPTPDAWAEAVRRVLTDPHLTGRLRAGALRAADRFSWPPPGREPPGRLRPPRLVGRPATDRSPNSHDTPGRSSPSPSPRRWNSKLTRLQSQLAGEVPEGRWSVTPPFHVTLAFLGDVETRRPVCPLPRGGRGGGTARAASNLKLEGLGAFPDARPAAGRLDGGRRPRSRTAPALQAAVAGASAGSATGPTRTRSTPTSPSAGSGTAADADPRPDPAVEPLPDLARRPVRRHRGGHLRLRP